MRKAAVLLGSAALLLQPVLVPPASASAHRTISVAVNKTAVDAGKRVVVSGKVTQAPAGRDVLIQLKAPGVKWRTVRTVPLKKDHTYKGKVRLTTPGTNRLRVLSGVEGGPEVSVKVYTWLNLTAQSHYVIAGSPYLVGSTKIDGTTFKNSFWSTGTNAWLYRLKDCTKIRATFARSGDNANVQGSYEGGFILSADEGDDVEHTYMIDGDPVSAVATIPAGLKYLNMGLGSFSDFPVAAIGTPQVRCAASSLPIVTPATFGF